MEGKTLIQSLLNSTGIKAESLENEFQRLLIESNASEETLTLEQLREILASYLQDVIVEAKHSLK